MARPTKIVEIHNNLGEVVTTTVADFILNHPEITRSHLYRAKGAVDANEVVWRIHEAPEIQKTWATTTQMVIYDFMRSDLAEEESSDNPDVDRIRMLKAGMASYERNLYLHTVHVVGHSNKKGRAAPERTIVI